MTGALRLARFALNCPSPSRTAAFFVQALGFSRADYPHAGAAEEVTLRLGPSRLDLTPAGPGARPYPKTLPPWSARFQHLALVTPDMSGAMERLRQTPGWTAISRGGAQRLPTSSGGVTAFKFRDPDGHPLELISFPADDNAPRIDHSAISVADTARSVAFYERLGLTVGPGSHQSRTRAGAPGWRASRRCPGHDAHTASLADPAYRTSLLSGRVSARAYRGPRGCGGDPADPDDTPC